MTEDYLNDYRRVREDRMRVEERLMELNSAMYALSGVSLEPSYGKSDVNRVDIFLDRKEELRRILIDKQIELMTAEAKIQQAIDTLAVPEQRTIIELYYIGKPGMKNATWQQVADEMHYSLRQTLRIKGEALMNLLEYEV